MSTVQNDIDDLLGDTAAEGKKPAAKKTAAKKEGDGKKEKAAAKKAAAKEEAPKEKAPAKKTAAKKEEAAAPAKKTAAKKEAAPKERAAKEPVRFAEGERDELIKQIKQKVRKPINSRELAEKLGIETRKLRPVLYSAQKRGVVVLEAGESPVAGMTVHPA
jgi:hypothetical protein